MAAKYHSSTELRFIEREVELRREGPYVVMTKVRILQQGWFPDGGGYIEWRDVPFVEQPETQEAGQK